MKHLGNGCLPGDATSDGRACSTYAGARRVAGHLILALTMASLISACSAADHASPTNATQRSSATTSSPETKAMKIRLTISGKPMTATLSDNPTARDFLALLPLTLALEDHASTEKIAYPPRKLSTQGASAGVDPEVGDIAYYAPWGNLAFYYRDFGYSPGLIRLGRIEAGIDALSVRGSLNVTIEAVRP